MQYAKRPWGWWLVLLKREKFKIKLLRFKQGCSISMQKHSYRSEFWMFLSGYGILKKAHTDKRYSGGDFVTIPRYHWHKYIAIRPTWILEVQYGDKCEETDIVRKDG